MFEFQRAKRLPAAENRSDGRPPDVIWKMMCGQSSCTNFVNPVSRLSRSAEVGKSRRRGESHVDMPSNTLYIELH